MVPLIQNHRRSRSGRPHLQYDLDHTTAGAEANKGLQSVCFYAACRSTYKTARLDLIMSSLFWLCWFGTEKRFRSLVALSFPENYTCA
jgi:hypothetical protein